MKKRPKTLLSILISEREETAEKELELREYTLFIGVYLIGILRLRLKYSKFRESVKDVPEAESFFRIYILAC